MPSVKVVDMTGKEVGEINLSEKLFGAEVSGPVLHAAVRAYLLPPMQIVIFCPITISPTRQCSGQCR